MGFLKNLLGVDPVKAEQKGDSFIENSDWGRAKIEFEKALGLLDKKAPYYHRSEKRLQDKLRRSKESLALEHKHNGEELIELGQLDEAKDLFVLAMELTEDESLISELEAFIHETEEESDIDHDIEMLDMLKMKNLDLMLKGMTIL